MASDLYSDTSSFGKLYVTLISVFIIIISIFGIFYGIGLLKQVPVYTLKTQMKITLISQTVDKSQTIIKGKVSECKNELILQGFPISTEALNIGDVIPVFIRPDGSCGDALFTEDNPYVTGVLIITIAIILILVSFFKIWLSKKYKAYAALQGVKGGLNIFKF